MKIVRREGFWWSKDEPRLPKPIPADKPWKGKREFLKALAKLESLIHSKYPPKLCKGWSNCRLCDDKNGSSTFGWEGWSWPSGFRHYVEAHNVRPSLAFQEFVLGYYVEED